MKVFIGIGVVGLFGAAVAAVMVNMKLGIITDWGGVCQKHEKC